MTLKFQCFVLSTALLFILCSILLINGQDQDNTEISNLNRTCLRCLCEAATGCNYTIGCNEEKYCGPFKISKIYWADADKVIFPDDDIEREDSFKDCALSYYCAIRIVKKYIENFAKDCNGDGVVDCDDYLMINYNGGYSCQANLQASVNGQAFQRRYDACRVKGF